MSLSIFEMHWSLVMETDIMSRTHSSQVWLCLNEAFVCWHNQDGKKTELHL